MPESKVSAHFTIGRDGSIVQHVSTYRRAWHGGRSIDAFGRPNVNDFSVGIEIDNIGDGSEPYPEEQVQAVEHVVSVLMRRHSIRQITSHEYIAEPQGRKNDPIDFPWSRMKRFHVPLYYGLKNGSSRDLLQVIAEPDIPAQIFRRTTTDTTELR
jgi:N-acetyl-anhydromuramyl-L-alanine amidase AmpD